LRVGFRHHHFRELTPEARNVKESGGFIFDRGALALRCLSMNARRSVAVSASV